MAKNDQKSAEQVEEERRAALTQDERDAEDLARMEEEEAAANARKSGQTGFDSDRDAITKRLATSAAAKRAKEATETGVVARGRHLFTEAGQTVPHTPGTTVALTPEEKAKLVISGHILSDDGNIEEPTGPRVFSDNLIEGHGTGQGSGDQPKPARR